MTRGRRALVAACSAAVLSGLLVACSAGDEPDPPAGAGATSPPAVPSEQPRVDPADEDLDARALERAAAAAKKAGSTCLLVARHGKVVGEWYWRGGSPTTAREVFSVTKSVTSTLVGLAAADGDLALGDRASAYVPEWRGTRSAGVTVRNLLANDSGREWSPDADYGSLLQAEDRSTYAVGLGQDARPGTVWAYNNAAIQTLDRVLGKATGEDVADYARERLFEPLGMSRTRMTEDPSGRSTNTFFGMQSTCPDLARFGQLFAQDGAWEGERLLPASWVREAVGAPSQELNAAYGLLWWLNRRGPLRAPLNRDDPQAPPSVLRIGRLAPGAPGDLFAAQGLGGQVVLVDPRSDTVVVRLGVVGQGEYGFAEAARVLTEALGER